MRWFILIVGMLVFFNAAYATAEEAEYNWITKCVDFSRNNKVVVDEKSNRVAFTDLPYIRFHDTPTDTYRWTYMMNQDIFCTTQNKRYFENNR